MSSYYADEDERDRRRRVEAELFLANRRRGSGESSYHPVPRPPPIYPARRVRRASTLPVRFEDERIPERGVRYDAPRPSRRYEPGEGLPPQAPPRRRETIDSLASSDSDTERGERRRKSVVEVLEERVPEAVEAGGTPARATSRVEELRSRSLSPPIRSRDQGGKTRIPARPVTKGAIIESGYAVEGRGDVFIPQEALQREIIEKLIQLGGQNLDSLDTIIERKRSRSRSRSRSYSRSRSRSRSPVHASRLDRDPREPSYSRRSRPRYYDDDLDVEQEAYSFTLSRHTKSLPSRDSTVGSLSDISEKDSVPPSDAHAKPSQPGKVLHVLKSHYTGDGSIGGFQSAEVKYSEGGSRKGSSVFKWYQFEDASMNFERFEGACDTISSLTESQKLGISRLFSRVRRKFDKQIQMSEASKIRSMAPGILREPVPRSETSKAGTVTWMCLPYFVLQKYSGSFSGLPPSSHPVRTLLQTNYKLARKERDMEQVVRQLEGTPPEHCFHIAQVWCLVLDDAFLITCSTAPISSLMGKSISFPTETPDQPKPRRNRPTNILVYSGNLLWSLPLTECQTWLGFTSHFWEYWPRRLQFSNGGKTVTPYGWSKIMAQASKSSVRIALEIRPSVKEPRGILLYSHISTSPVKNPPNPSDAAQGQPNRESSQDFYSKATSGKDSADRSPSSSSNAPNVGDPSILQPDSDQKNTEANKERPPVGKAQQAEKLGSDFHVFTWLNEAQITTWPTTNLMSGASSLNPEIGTGDRNAERPFILDELSLQEDLNEIDRFLKRQTSFEERLTYEECIEHARGDIYAMLKKEEESIAALKEKDSQRTRIFEDKIEIVNKAETLFRLFIPSHSEGRTIGKFWGALYRLLVSLDPTAPEGVNPFRTTARMIRGRDATQVLQWLGYATQTTSVFKEMLSHANSNERSMIEVPEELPKAWLHLLMAVIFSFKDQYMMIFEEQSDVCSQLLNEGMRKVVENLGQKSLLEYAVFKPWELASLVNFVLLRDITGQSPDISDTYLEYMTYLESAVQANPLDRGHQDKLTAFRQEISIIQKTLMQQRLILDYAQRLAATPGPSDNTRHVHYDPSPSYLPPAPRESSYLRPDPHYSSHSRSRSYSRDVTYGRSHTRAEYYDDDPYISNPRPSAYQSISRPRTPGSQIDPIDPSSIQGLLIQDSYALIDRKMREFEEMATHASELEAWNTLKIDYNKDRQEAAVYAFTIVTIIFLPLSTVAGILGMNVNDVRNMEINQWVFWAVALPLTVIIITLCLIWAGEVENFWKGFRNLWGTNKKTIGGRQYEMLNGRSDALSMMDPRADPGRVAARIVNRREFEDVGRYRPLYGRSRSRANDDEGYY